MWLCGCVIVWLARLLQVREAQELNPVFINSHSGNDYFTVAQAEEFFSGALEFQEQEGDITHGTRVVP